MRTIEATVGGKVYSMPVGFASSMRLHEKGIDPLKLSAALAEREGLTLWQVITIITVGVRCAGCQLTDEAIGDDIIETGPQGYILPAAKYVVALVAGAPKIPVADSKKKDEPAESAEQAA
jgi:hypothetical protein